MFSTTLQAIIFLLDAGFSAAVRRELSWGTKDDRFVVKASSFVKTLEFFYGVLFIFLIVITFFSADWVANNWFNFKFLNQVDVKNALILMVIIAVLQMQSSLYNGSLQALEFQIESNVLQILLVLFRNGFVIFILFYYNSPVAFLLWQLIVMILFIFIQRYVLFNKLFSFTKDAINKGQRQFKLLKKSLKLSLVFLLISIFSTINLQIDKIIISKLLPISNIGYYNTVYSLGQILVSITGPISVALAPRLIRAYSINDNITLSILFHKFSKFNSILTAALGVTILTNSYSIISLWINNPSFSELASPLTPFMIVAGICLASQTIPFNLAVASTDLKPIILTCIVNIIVTIPCYFWTTSRYGIKGTALVWMLSNIGMMLFNVYFYLRKSLPRNFYLWLTRDVLIPLTTVGIFTLLLSFFRPKFSYTIFEIISIGFIFIISFLFGLVFFFRLDIYIYISKFRNRSLSKK